MNQLNHHLHLWNLVLLVLRLLKLLEQSTINRSIISNTIINNTNTLSVVMSVTTIPNCIYLSPPLNSFSNENAVLVLPSNQSLMANCDLIFSDVMKSCNFEIMGSWVQILLGAKRQIIGYTVDLLSRSIYEASNVYSESHWRDLNSRPPHYQ